MGTPSYVLVTPVKNEEATIRATLESVVNQTLLPKEWVIVSDRSTDSTEEIVERFQTRYAFIRLVRMEGQCERSFSSVVRATETGIRSLSYSEYEFLGLLDADVRFNPSYYETLIHRFSSNLRLGLAGGLVLDVDDGKVSRARQYLGDIAGATQFFRRECFESLGGLIAVPEGGWDALTCVQARANGYETATFPDLIVDHLKPRNVSAGNVLQRCWQMGVRDYALGSHPFFELLKCLSRGLDRPPIVGATARIAAFLWCTAVGRRRVIADGIIDKVRHEQMNRITQRLFGKLGQPSRASSG